MAKKKKNLIKPKGEPEIKTRPSERKDTKESKALCDSCIFSDKGSCDLGSGLIMELEKDGECKEWKKKKHAGGRPSKIKGIDLDKVSEEYERNGNKEELTEEKFKMIFELAELGMTNEQITDYLKVNVTTLWRWEKDNPKFCKALKKAREMSDEKIENALFNRARGYTHSEEKIFCNKDGEITRADTVKHYAPDPTSMIFWLKNRQPKKWRDKQEIEHKGDGLGKVVIEIRKGSGVASKGNPEDNRISAEEKPVKEKAVNGK